MDQVVIRSASRNRFSTLLLGVLAFTAILLACIVLYGLMSYSVERRTLEFGVRLALGAESGSLRNMILKHAMLLAAIGIVVGLGGAYELTRMLAVVALLASYVPARRAVRIDPMVALRYE
jgi:ABC-type antimicrobial peptide transport system permease subunit